MRFLPLLTRGGRARAQRLGGAARPIRCSNGRKDTRGRGAKGNSRKAQRLRYAQMRSPMCAGGYEVCRLSAADLPVRLSLTIS